MKIEDSPFRFQAVSPLDRLRRNQPPVEAMLDDLDLSFLDLLTSVTDRGDAPRPDANASVAEEARKAQKTSATQQPADAGGKPKLTLVGKTEPSALSAPENLRTEVAEDMKLLKDDLTPADLQYLKQAVIPGLPILLGSVPVESVFPADGAGGISYKGHEISPKLAELISKGYRTGQPIRVDLDANSAVVLKIRNGQVSAEFVSGDKTAMLVMQQELDDLRHRLTLKNLPVGTLDARYRDPERQQQQDNEEDSGKN